MAAKLTLSMDERVIRRAKRYARAKKTSVSHLVEQFLSLLSPETKEPEVCGFAAADFQPEPPILRDLRGSLKQGGDREDYRQHLEDKYR
ncbi:MAG TPA: DUF6364 family protein [Polyangiaceae bacterium]|nr:DUF6364 family protein [Polyangiaceae bacterium]